MSGPKLLLQTHVSPRGIPVGAQERVVTVLLEVTAPGQVTNWVPRPLNLGLLIDKSGSMHGTKIETARVAAERVVKQLADNDTFTLVTFNESHEVVVPATRIGGSRESIMRQIRSIDAGGRTNMTGALQSALANLRPHCGAQVTSAMYILTDGEVHDAAECLPVASSVFQQGVSIYSGGIGDEYKHDFLDKICFDPVEKGKYLVEDIALTKLSQMSTKFEEFVARKGHVVSANCRLTINVDRGAELYSATAVEHARVLNLDAARSTTIPDVAVGTTATYKFEFQVRSQIEGFAPLAQFRLKYDLPGSNVLNAEAITVASVAITHNQNDWVSNPVVTHVERKMSATQMMEAALEVISDLKTDPREATGILKRASTRILDVANQCQDESEKEKLQEKAGEVEQIIQQIDQQVPRDVLVKRTRGTTKMIGE